MIDARNPETGFQVGYAHLALLLHLTDDDAADRLLEECLQGSWTVGQLRRRVKRLAALAAAPRRRVRPRPWGFAGLLENIDAATGGWLESFTEVWRQGGALPQALARVPREQVTAALLKRIEEVEAQALEAAEAARAVAEELGAARQRAREALDPPRPGAGTAGGPDEGRDGA